MDDKQQTAECKGYASVNPKVEYIRKDIAQNDDHDRNYHLCFISQFHTVTPLYQV